MKIIYWNTKKNCNVAPLREILKTEEPSILFLSEFNEKLNNYIKLDISQFGYEHLETPGCKRIIVLVHDSVKVNLCIQESFFTMLSMQYFNEKVNIFGVHFPSQLFKGFDELKSILRDFRVKVDKYAGDSLYACNLLIGDFNSNPFESPLLGFDGFRASNSNMVRETIIRNEGRGSTYINPTWQLYARFNCPGTIRYNRPSASSFDILEWHYLDQVLISHKLNKILAEYNVSIIEKVGALEFLDSRKAKVLFSDHLPIKFEFRRKSS